MSAPAQQPRQCPTCAQAYQDEPGKALHENLCPKFRCTSCGADFALFPDPVKKTFGPKPQCHACRQNRSAAFPIPGTFRNAS